jgi:hypothetical protein
MATKTGGGLLGRADSTLVQGALKAEFANVGPNMQGIYKMQAENVGNLQTAIQDIFYATNKSNNDLYNEIKEQSSLILADIESGTFSDDNSIDLYTNAINDLREQAKSIPKGRKGEAQRAKIKAQLAKMKTDSANGESVITEIATLIDNDQISQYAVNENDLKLFKDILSGDAKREIVNGELVYSTVDANNNPIKINHNELNKRFVKKDYTVEAGALKLSSSFSKIGLQGTPYDFNEALNSYEGLMTTKGGFMHLISKPFGTMKISFAQALQGGDSKLVGEMMGALNSIGGVDIDGDGNPDQITQQNYKKLADILTNPDPANFSVAKRAAAAFYADNDGRAQHKKGLDIFNAKKDKLDDPGGGVVRFKDNQTFAGGVTGSQLNTLIDKLNSGSISVGNVNYNVDPNNNSWTSENGDIISGNDMLNALKKQMDAAAGGKSTYYFPTDSRFSKFQGTKKKPKELTSSLTIDSANTEIENFFKNIELIDNSANYIPSKDPFDVRMGKNRIDLKDIVKKMLNEAGLQENLVSTSLSAPNSITLNDKQYTFKEGDFDYNEFVKDLNELLKQSGVSKNNDLNPNIEK